MTAAGPQGGGAPGRRPRWGRRLGIGALVVAALIGAGWLSLQRGDLPWSTLDAKYASPASRWMDLPGRIRVHYRDQGRRDGPVIVLVHGFSASLHTWEPWVQRLGDQYRMVSLDLPGPGLTRTPAGYVPGRDDQVRVVDAVSRKLGLDPFVLVGNSMGGGVAWQYALAHPERLSALVLVDAAGYPLHMENRSSPVVFQLMRNPVGRALIKNLDMRGLTTQGLKAAYYDERLVTPQLVDRYVEPARAPGHRDILLSLPIRVATLAELGSIKVPTLVMHGRQDKLIPFAAGEGFARAIPGAELAAYDGVGHIPMEQIPDRSAADLRAFLVKHGIGEASARSSPH